MKFGGTSVEDARAFERVAALVSSERRSNPVVVVVSAMSRFTDALLAAFERAAAGEGERAALSLEEHFARHTEVLRVLLPETRDPSEVSAAVGEFDEVLAHAREHIGLACAQAADGRRPLPELQDLVVSFGEQLSSRLLACVLDARGVARAAGRRAPLRHHRRRARPRRRLLKEETERHTCEQLEPLIEAKA